MGNINNAALFLQKQDEFRARGGAMTSFRSAYVKVDFFPCGRPLSSQTRFRSLS